MNQKYLTARSFEPLPKRDRLPRTVRLRYPAFVQEPLIGHSTTIAITLETCSHVLPQV
jgi:hypothetical protein